MTAIASRLRSIAPDRLLAAGLLVAAQAECWLSPAVEGQRPETAVAAAIMTAALAWRRIAPLAVMLVIISAFVALALTAGLPNATFLLPTSLLAVYSLAAHASPDRAVVGLALALAAVPISGARTDDATVTDMTAPALLFVAAWFTGRSLRSRRLRAAELEAHAAHLEHEQESAQRAAAEAERARIARELHDIVAHRVTTIVIQSESGLATLDEPERTRAALQAIGDSGREALSELRRLLGLLRDEDAAAATSPQPGLAQLDRLVADTRAAGLPVQASVEGEVAGLPAGVDLTAYRIVQESLTNALRHARTATSVSVRRDEHALAVEVRNGMPDRPLGNRGAGEGLAGMRERVRVYGGRLAAGPSGGDFVVSASLPVDGRRA